MKTLRHKRAAEHANGRRQQGIERLQPVIGRQFLLGKIDMCALAERVHAGISSSRAMNANARAANFVEGALETILHGVAMGLTLPAGKMTAVVGNNQFQPPRHSVSATLPLRATISDDPGKPPKGTE